MVEDKADSHDLVLVSDATRTRELEARYISLLEKRIAALEELVKEQTTKPPATTTTEENLEKFLSGDSHNKERNNSITSPSELCPPPTRIRFQESRYNVEGVETVEDVSDKSTPVPERLQKRRDPRELTWRRVFDKKNIYQCSQVEIESVELLALLQIELAHDPRFHSPSESINNRITLTSPFEPLVHSWARLEKLASADNDGSTSEGLERRISDIYPRTDKVETAQHTRALVILADEGKRKKALTDLAALLQQVRTIPELKTYFPTLEAQRQVHSIQFEFLWTIFPPGELVYSTVFMKMDQIFIVKKCESDIVNESDSGKERDVKKVWSLVCWSYDWNGKTFDRVPITFKFDEFQGTRLINTLHCYPLRYRNAEMNESGTEQLRADLIERGKRFRGLCIKPSGSQMFDYDGDAISHGAGFQLVKESQTEDAELPYILALLLGRRRRASKSVMPDKQGKKQHISGRVMVDFESYLQHAPKIRKYGPMGDAIFSKDDDECRCASCMNNQALKDNQKMSYDNYNSTKEFMDEIQYLICPPRVLGYHLDSRTWLELESAKMVDIKHIQSKEAFDKLELATTQKNLIRELVESHTSGNGKKPLMEDIMKEKGKGLVILLHGPPGVGKTLTAESVAQLAGKPLFSVSPSDIGLNPTEVEQNLEALFELAARWRAVLLFDEADVFLESRSSHTSDLTRNALVSVLLRVLEYYSGILILTTNRIQQFDIAVQSRVNLGIKYKDLSTAQKKKIFSNFIDQIHEDNIGDKDDLERWLDEEDDAKEWFDALNGRQVRNVLFSAASLALNDGGVLKVTHIKKMAKSTWQFQDSIKSIVQEARRKAEVGRE